MLAGFMPKLFDQLAGFHDQSVYSFNSGFPGTAIFLPQLETICRRGQAPDVLLLQYPWGKAPPKRDLFHVILNDHTVIADLFPFREFVRDTTDFLMTARTHGGIKKLYRDSQANGRKVIEDKGYYLITEQSRFPSGRLPDDFHLATDTPNTPQPRKIPPPNSESRELQALLLKHHMRCFVVPFYMRIGEAAAPAAYDPKFAAVVESATSCKVLGPDYFLYPNRDFSDQTHLNADGARAYTQALFQLLQKPLSEGSQGAVQ
jgi:hypothetical protein